jgi:hydroxyacylglutathione hydrolase
MTQINADFKKPGIYNIKSSLYIIGGNLRNLRKGISFSIHGCRRFRISRSRQSVTNCHRLKIKNSYGKKPDFGRIGEMKLTEKIHLLKLDFEINLKGQKLNRFVNCIIIFGKKITLIDSGVKGSAPKIFDYIKECGRDFEDIETVILSHSHPDHMGSAAEIKKITGCRVLAHEGEKGWIENIETQVRERPVPGFFDLVDESAGIDGFLDHGQIIKADEDIKLRIIHSPGHSRGSINILFEEDKILFTADSIPVKNDIPNYDNFNDLMKSLHFIRTNKDYAILLTSWTPPLIDRKEIEKFLDEGEGYLKTLDEAVTAIYAGEESVPLEFCRKAILKLGLPDIYVNPIVDRAFRGHKKRN